MSDNYTINNLRSRRNGFIGNGPKRARINEEKKKSSGNQFIASLIMNPKRNLFQNEV